MSKKITKLELSEIENYTFLDIDDGLEDALEHFNKKHEDFYVKLSSNKNLHVLVKDPCDICNKYNDHHYDGKLLFLTKGDKIANKLWRDKYRKLYKFEYKKVFHFLIEDHTYKIKTYHIYQIGEIDFDKVNEIFKENNKYTDIYMTLHYVLCKESTENFTSSNITSSGSVYPFEDYLDIMKFESIENLDDIRIIENEFDLFISDNIF